MWGRVETRLVAYFPPCPMTWHSHSVFLYLCCAQPILHSVVVAFSNSFDQSPLVHAITTLQRSVRIVQVGLILFMLLFSSFLGVSRKQFSFGISLGFGLFAGVELMLMALNSGGFVRPGNLNLINMVTYIIAILIWLCFSLSRKAVRVAPFNLFLTQ